MATATKAQIARWQRFPEIGCAACTKIGIFTLPEVHHLLSGGRRRGHDFTIPLCPYHHRGLKPYPFLVAANEIPPPSLAREPKRFRETYGDDDVLFAQTNQRLERFVPNGKPKS